MLSYDQSPYNSHRMVLSPIRISHSMTYPPVPRLRHKHLFIITGPAGCGKTTVAQHLSEALGFPYVEGDDYHPESNRQKMSRGEGLADADRWDWLINLKEATLSHLDTGADGAIVTCSALKRKYRDVIRIARLDNHEVRVHFIYLRASKEVLKKRVAEREGHFMKSDMVESQFQDLEEPKPKEEDVVTLPVGVKDPASLTQQRALDSVVRILATDAAASRKAA